MEPNALVRAIVEFDSKALILGHRVGLFYQRELKKGNRAKLEELQSQVDKYAKEKEAWEKEREEWREEKKRLGTWRVRCLDSEEKFKAKVANLEADYDELKEKHKGLEVELENLKGCIIQEHINGFQKGLRQAPFFCKDVDVADPRFYVNKDVVDGQLVNEVESSPEEEGEKAAIDDDKNEEEAVMGGDD